MAPAGHARYFCGSRTMHHHSCRHLAYNELGNSL
jgi:hypothetical protein